MEKDWNPGQLLELSGSYWQTCALHAGVALDVFSVLGEERLPPETVAVRLASDPRATEMLLNALTAMGLLVKFDRLFANSPAASVYLCRHSDKFLGHIIKHHHHLVPMWAQLPEAVRSGRPRREGAAQADEERRESFLLGMFNLASLLAPVLVKQVDLAGRRRFLDLGGGPGTYAIHFCLQNPQLQAVVYDLPTTRPFAEKTIARFGLRERIEFHDGDFLRDGVKGAYDVVWLSHILHGEGPEGCARIIEQAVSALEAGRADPDSRIHT